MSMDMKPLFIAFILLKHMSVAAKRAKRSPGCAAAKSHVPTAAIDGRHPLNVQPLGNAYSAEDGGASAAARRASGLGGLAVLPDELILKVCLA